MNLISAQEFKGLLDEARTTDEIERLMTRSWRYISATWDEYKDLERYVMARFEAVMCGPGDGSRPKGADAHCLSAAATCDK